MVLILVGVALIATIGQKQVPVAAVENHASIEFELRSHDFGDIKEADGSVEHAFEFTNSGVSDLLVLDVKASCGCTSPEWTREPVRPGESGFIRVRFNPENRPGTFNKSLTVVSNAASQQVRLHLIGSVVSIERSIEEEYPKRIGGLLVAAKAISFETLIKEKPVTKSLKVYNDTDEEIHFKKKVRAPSHLTVKFIPQALAPKSSGKIEVSYDPRDMKQLGIKSDYIEIETNESVNNVKKFIVAANLEEYFPPMTSEELALAPRLEIKNPSYDFGTIREGETVTCEFLITNTGRSKLNIRQTRATCGCTVSKPEKSNLKAGESSIIKVSFDSARRSGEQNKTIMVYSNDPSNPTQNIKIHASIVEGV